MFAGAWPSAGWKFAELPLRPQIGCALPAELPARLGRLLHTQPSFLRELTNVKLRIIARTYLRWPKGSPEATPALSEDELCDLLEAAIRVRSWPGSNRGSSQDATVPVSTDVARMCFAARLGYCLTCHVSDHIFIASYHAAGRDPSLAASHSHAAQ